jgi:TonB family protein
VRFAAPIVAAWFALVVCSSAQDQVQQQPSQSSRPQHGCSTWRTYSSKPHFPDHPIRAVIGYDLTADGTVGKVHLVESSGDADFDEAALSCLTQRKHMPPHLRDGVPVDAPNQTTIIQSNPA